MLISIHLELDAFPSVPLTHSLSRSLASFSRMIPLIHNNNNKTPPLQMRH